MENLPFERVKMLFRAKIQACRNGEHLSEEAIHEILNKERTEEDKQADDEIDDNQFDSELENDETNAIGEEFANKLDASEKSLAEPGISKTHSEVSAATVGDSAKIQDLFGYVQQNSTNRAQE